MGEQLFLKLWPIASGNHGHPNDCEEVMQQRRHFHIERRLAFRQRAVQIIDDELLHQPSPWSSCDCNGRFRPLPASWCGPGLNYFGIKISNKAATITAEEGSV